MSTKNITLQPVMEGSVRRIRFTIKKDGVVWVGIDSVTLKFEKPDRATRFDRDMVLVTPDVGVWYYDTTTDDLDEAGNWTLGLTVVDGAVTIKYPYEISLEVTDQP